MGYIVASGFKHTQTTPATVWTINHQIGQNNSMAIPMVDVYVTVDGRQEKIIPFRTEMTSKGQLQLEFTSAYSGFALITA